MNSVWPYDRADGTLPVPLSLSPLDTEGRSPYHRRHLLAVPSFASPDGTMSDLEWFPAEPETAQSTVSTVRVHRHKWATMADDEHGVYSGCIRCGVIQDPVKSRLGKQSRNYGNRAELKAARLYGGTKVGHAGGPVDIRGTDFATQMKTHRRKPPVEWTVALGAMDEGNRCPRLLLRFVFPAGPEDYFVFRAKDFLDWFGRDDEAA